jgi:hypothetical protein
VVRRGVADLLARRLCIAGAVIVVFALIQRDLPVPGAVKFLLLAPASVATCFAPAGIPRKRSPG